MIKFNHILFRESIETIAIIIISFAVLFGLFLFDEEGYQKHYDTHYSNVGKSVVVEGDTLVITDVSMLRYNYILSDGREIPIDEAKKLILKD